MLENALPQEGLNLAEKLLGGGVTAQVPDTEKKNFLFFKKTRKCAGGFFTHLRTGHCTISGFGSTSDIGERGEVSLSSLSISTRRSDSSGSSKSN